MSGSEPTATSPDGSPTAWGGRAALTFLAVLAVALTALTVVSNPPDTTGSEDRHPAPYEVRHLSDMPYTAISNGAGPIERDMTNGGEDAEDGDPIEIHGVRFEHGLGVYPDSRVRLHRPSGCDRILATAAAVGDSAASDRLIFTVEGDGRQLYQSLPTGIADGPLEVDVELGSVERVDMIVTSEQPDVDVVASAVWADARLPCLG